MLEPIGPMTLAGACAAPALRGHGRQIHDSKVIDAFVGWQEPAKAIADKGAMAVISSKSNAKMRIPHNRDLYAMLNLVEWFFLQNERHAQAYKTYEKSNEMTSPLSTSSRSSFS